MQMPLDYMHVAEKIPELKMKILILYNFFPRQLCCYLKGGEE